MFVEPLTLGNKCMDGQKTSILRVFDVDTVHKILQEEKVSRTSLNNCEKPVP
jgi:hypothetical protein